MAPWCVDLIERLFLPSRWRERQRLGPEIDTFESKMVRFQQGRAAQPDPEGPHPRQPLTERGLKDERGFLASRYLLAIQVVLASLAAAYVHGFTTGLREVEATRADIAASNLFDRLYVMEEEGR